MPIKYLTLPDTMSVEHARILKENYDAWNTHMWEEIVPGYLRCSVCGRGNNYHQGVSTKDKPEDLTCQISV